MRIDKLELIHFRNHRETTLDFAGYSFIVIRGKNFAGKSSIGQALSLALTPSTTGLDARGGGYHAKIGRGASKAMITARIQGKHHLIERTVTLSAGSAGRTQRSICLNDPGWTPHSFDRQLEDKRAALTVALNSDAFLRMDEKEQKNLLAGLALPRRYDFDRAVVEAVERLLGAHQVNFNDAPFAVIQEAYKLLYEERQIVNRQVREFTVPEPLPVPPGVDSASLQAELTALRMERKERDQERARAVEAATTQTVERERLKTRAHIHGEAIASEEHQAQAIRAFLLPDERLAELRRVAMDRGELDRLIKEKEEIETVLDDYLRQGGRLEELPEAGTQCPTCDQLIDPDRMAAMAARLTAGIQEAKNKNQQVYDQIAALRAVKEAAEGIEKQEKALQELADIEARVGERRRLLEEAEKNLPPAALFDFAPLEQSLADLDAEIERRSAQLRPVIAAEERQREIIERVRQREGLKDKAARLDKLVKYFDKDGIKAKLIAEHIGGFEAKLNEVLSAWGYGCALSIEPYQFQVTNARGDTIPVRELSGAERVMFSVAFQCAVSRTASLGLVVIDEVAMLLPELRPGLYRRLYETIRSGYLEQVIVLVAETTEQVPALPGSAFFMVDEGQVYELRRELLAG